MKDILTQLIQRTEKLKEDGENRKDLVVGLFGESCEKVIN